jgi:hypothetical protein
MARIGEDSVVDGHTADGFGINPAAAAIMVDLPAPYRPINTVIPGVGVSNAISSMKSGATEIVMMTSVAMPVCEYIASGALGAGRIGNNDYFLFSISRTYADDGRPPLPIIVNRC